MKKIDPFLKKCNLWKENRPWLIAFIILTLILAGLLIFLGLGSDPASLPFIYAVF